MIVYLDLCSLQNTVLRNYKILYLFLLSKNFCMVYKGFITGALLCILHALRTTLPASCILHPAPCFLCTLHLAPPVTSAPFASWSLCSMYPLHTHLQTNHSCSPTPFQILNFIQSMYCKLDLLSIKCQRLPKSSLPPNQ